jgi:hypothetical protein
VSREPALGLVHLKGRDLPRWQNAEDLIMNLELLKLELLRCLERAEKADHEYLRRQWLSAAETWQFAIESRARIHHLTIEWATLKSVANGKAGSSIS